MKPSGSPLTRAWMTWTTAPAIATPVASTTLPVIRYKREEHDGGEEVGAEPDEYVPHWSRSSRAVFLR